MKLTKKDLLRLPITHAVLFSSLEKKGFEFEKLEETNLMLVKVKAEVKNDGKTKRRAKQMHFIGGYTPLVPHGLGMVFSNKYFVRELLKQSNISVVKGDVFQVTEKRTAVKYAKEIMPVLLRTENSNNSVKAITNISTVGEFLKGWSSLVEYQESLLVEEMFFGKNIRIFIDKNGFFQVLLKTKKPRKNIFIVNKAILFKRYIGLDKRSFYVARSSLKQERLKKKLLKKEKPSVSIKKKETIYLGEFYYEDITSSVSKSFYSLAKKILELSAGLSFVSFDVLTKAYSKKLTKKSYVVTEVYHSPGLHMFFDMHKYKSQQKRGIDIVVGHLF